MCEIGFMHFVSMQIAEYSGDAYEVVRELRIKMLIALMTMRMICRF